MIGGSPASPASMYASARPSAVVMTPSRSTSGTLDSGRSPPTVGPSERTPDAAAIVSPPSLGSWHERRVPVDDLDRRRLTRYRRPLHDGGRALARQTCEHRRRVRLHARDRAAHRRRPPRALGGHLHELAGVPDAEV